MAKAEALENITKFFKSKNLDILDISFSKVHQSNKKPAFRVDVEIDEFGFMGYVYQNNQHDWVIHTNDLFYQNSISDEDFEEYKIKMIESKNNANKYMGKINHENKVKSSRKRQPSREEKKVLRENKKGFF